MYGNTSIHYAAHNGGKELITRLLPLCGNVAVMTMRNRAGQRPVDIMKQGVIAMTDGLAADGCKCTRGSRRAWGNLPGTSSMNRRRVFGRSSFWPGVTHLGNLASRARSGDTQRYGRPPWAAPADNLPFDRICIDPVGPICGCARLLPTEALTRRV